jgi:hypothetical protein
MGTLDYSLAFDPGHKACGRERPPWMARLVDLH